MLWARTSQTSILHAEEPKHFSLKIWRKMLWAGTSQTSIGTRLKLEAVPRSHHTLENKINRFHHHCNGQGTNHNGKSNRKIFVDALAKKYEQQYGQMRIIHGKRKMSSMQERTWRLIWQLWSMIRRTVVETVTCFLLSFSSIFP